MVKRRRTKAKSPPSDYDRLETEWTERLTRWHESIRDLPYDGIVGTLPAWIPEPVRREFEDVRRQLFWPRWRNNPSVEYVRRKFNAYISNEPFLLLSVEDRGYMARLARWYRIVNLGPKRGAIELGIPEAAVVAHAKKFVGRKRGARQPESRYILALVTAKPHESARGLWTYLRLLLGKPEDQRVVAGVPCPFVPRYRGAILEVLKRGRSYPYKTFANAVSRERNRQG